MSGSQGSITGFSFNAPALILNGQNVGGSFNFDLPVVAASSATDAYNFVANANSGLLSFVTSADNKAVSNVLPTIDVTNTYLANLGNQYAWAAQEAARNIPSGGAGGTTGAGDFLNILGGLGSIF